MKSGKVWGTTEVVESTDCFEFHRIEFKANVCCSEHYHKTKWNGFYVESGSLLVKVWQGDERDATVDHTVLRPGDYFKVPPGQWHQFVGVDDGVAFELYWSRFNEDDIVRRTEGKRLDTVQTERHIGNPLTDLNHE